MIGIYSIPAALSCRSDSSVFRNPDMKEITVYYYITKKIKFTVRHTKSLTIKKLIKLAYHQIWLFSQLSHPTAINIVVTK